MTHGIDGYPGIMRIYDPNPIIPIAFALLIAYLSVTSSWITAPSGPAASPRSWSHRAMRSGW